MTHRWFAALFPRFAGQPRRLALIYATLALSLILPVVATVWMGYTLIVGQLRELAFERASYLLQRADSISEQIGIVTHDLAGVSEEEPCGPKHLQRMRELSVRSPLLAGIGYVHGSALQCSSFGLQSIDVGEPSYLGSLGYFLRTAIPTELNGSDDLILSTNKRTGYTAIVRKSTLLDSMALRVFTSTGLVGMRSRKPIAYRGILDPQWFQQTLVAKKGAQRVAGDMMVWSVSDNFDFLSYVVVPRAVVLQRLNGALPLLIPGGLLIGALFAVGVFVLARMQSSVATIIRAGLRSGEFYLLYQPIVDLRDGSWVGSEALLRWQRRATGEVISPDIFIPVAEKMGLMGRVTMRVLELVEQSAPALCARRKDFFISINFAAQDFSNARLLEKTRTMVTSTSLVPRNIHIEATERVFLDPKAAQAGLSALREMGIEVAIDDFGTGFSGLAYLTETRLDCLKIDKCFVRTIGKDSVTSSVVGHIIDLAKSLNMTIIAEGVETQEQAQYLQACGVQMAQGWLYGKPMPPLELAGHLQPVTHTADDGGLRTGRVEKERARNRTRRVGNQFQDPD